MKKIKKNNIIIISSIVVVILIIFGICFCITPKITKEVKDKYGVKEAKIVGFHFCKVCDFWLDGCISYKPKYNCQKFTVEADGARGVVVRENGYLNTEDVKLGLRCDKVIKQTLKILNYDDYEYEEEIGVRRIKIKAHQNLREIIDLDYLSKLDEVNIAIYKEFPTANDSFGLQYDIYYNDGYIVGFNNIYSGYSENSNKIIITKEGTDRKVVLSSPYGDKQSGEKSIKDIKNLIYTY